MASHMSPILTSNITPMKKNSSKFTKVNEIINSLKANASTSDMRQSQQQQPPTYFMQQNQLPMQPLQLSSPTMKASRLNGSTDSYPRQLMAKRQHDGKSFDMYKSKSKLDINGGGVIDSVLLTDPVNSSSGAFEASNYVLACEIERLTSEMNEKDRVISGLKESNAQLCGINASQMVRVNSCEQSQQEDKRRIDLYETNILMLDENINRLESRLEDKKRELAEYLSSFDAQKAKIAEDAVQKLSQTFLKEQAELEAKNSQLKSTLANTLAKQSEEQIFQRQKNDELWKRCEALERIAEEAKKKESENNQLREELVKQRLKSQTEDEKAQQLIMQRDAEITALKSAVAELSSTPSAIQSGELKMQIYQQNQTIESMKKAIVAIDMKYKEVAGVLLQKTISAQAAEDSCKEMTGEIEVLKISIQCKDKECDELYDQLKQIKYRNTNMNASIGTPANSSMYKSNSLKTPVWFEAK